MKLVKIPEGATGKIWDVLVHDLTVDPILKNAKIHHLKLFTLLGRYSIKITDKHGLIKNLFDLENKVQSVLYFHHELETKLKTFKPVFLTPKIQDYSAHQEIISILEAYLNAIYSLLDIVAKINKKYDSSLKETFNKQNERKPMFDDGVDIWYNKFHDLRSELTHYSSFLPLIKDGMVYIQNTNKREKRFFKGKTEYGLSFKEILNWTDDLIYYLEVWSQSMLNYVDKRDTKIQVITGFNKDNTVQTKQVTVRSLMSRRTTEYKPPFTCFK